MVSDGLRESYAGEDTLPNFILSMDAVLTDDEFAPGTPPLQKAWEDGVVGKCAEGGDIGGGGELGGAMGDASSGEEALLVGRKRGCFALDAEVEEA